MAAASDSTPVSRAEKRILPASRSGCSYDHLEDIIDDLQRATILLETMHEDVRRSVSDKVGQPPNPRDGYIVYMLSEDQRDGLEYAMFHVGDLVRELAKRFSATERGAR